MVIQPTSEPIGAQIKGLSLAGGISDAQFAAVNQAWLDHLVLVFRDQVLEERDLIDFSARFGTLDVAPNDKNGPQFIEGYPELLLISNVRENGRLIGGLGNAEAAWHTDMSYNEIPPKGSALYAREIPQSGGDTGFLNMYTAYEALPDALRERVGTLKLKHDSTHNSVSELRLGLEVPRDVTSSPGAIHPIVRTHPESGRKALFLGRRQFAYIVGLSVDESEDLLDTLWSHCEQPQFGWHHQWCVGDLVLWDNRCVMHRRDSFDPSERRLMVRTQVQGDRPF